MLSSGCCAKISRIRTFCIGHGTRRLRFVRRRRALAASDLKNLPNVAVRDIFLQADRNDILLATHGRGLYILDDATPMQQMAAALCSRFLSVPDSPRATLFRAQLRVPAEATPNTPQRIRPTARFWIITCATPPKKCASKCSIPPEK